MVKGTCDRNLARSTGAKLLGVKITVENADEWYTFKNLQQPHFNKLLMNLLKLETGIKQECCMSYSSVRLHTLTSSHLNRSLHDQKLT